MFVLPRRCYQNLSAKQHSYDSVSKLSRCNEHQTYGMFHGLKFCQNVSFVSLQAKQMLVTHSRYMVSAYEQATEHPRSFLFVDLTPETPSNQRLRSSILSVSGFHCHKNSNDYRRRSISG